GADVLRDRAEDEQRLRRHAVGGAAAPRRLDRARTHRSHATSSPRASRMTQPSGFAMTDTTTASLSQGRREATKQANRPAILDAARDVFAQLGYGAATVRDIVRRTDLATGTFYNYFPD